MYIDVVDGISVRFFGRGGVWFAMDSVEGWTLEECANLRRPGFPARAARAERLALCR